MFNNIPVAQHNKTTYQEQGENISENNLLTEIFSIILDAALIPNNMKTLQKLIPFKINSQLLVAEQILFLNKLSLSD